MMKRTVTAMRQYLAAAFFIAIGLIAYGCGDSASINPVVELASLTVDPGTLQPAFSGGTTQYNVDLSNNITSVTITAQPAVAGDTVSINGQATTSSVIQLGAAGTTTPVSIVVSESGTNSRTYTVLLVRAGLTGNNSLQNLNVSPGTLAPTFDSNVQAYTVDVANNVGSFTVTPTLSDPAATMTVNGQATNSGQPRTISLNPAGQPTTIPIVVTAQNGNPKTYQVTVSRGVSSNNNLQSLTISPGTLNPTFNANRTSTSYTVNVASAVASITVTPRVQDPAATMTVNGQATTSGQGRNIQLGAPDSNTPIFIIVTAQNGTQKTYTVGVNRAALGGNNNLSGLTVSPGPLSPSFNAGTEDYTVNVASTVASITVTPTRQDPNATITVNGQPTNSGQARTITLSGAGSNTLINIEVTAPNGSEKTYTINVIRAALGGNNNLSGLTVSPGNLSPSFAAARTSYTVSVGSSVGSINVTATKADTNASMTINGQGTNSGQARSISLGAPGSSTEIDITVVAPNGNDKSYLITVNRAAPSSNNNLSALSVSPGSLTPSFAAGTEDYTVSVITDVTSINVSATKADANAVMSGSVTAGTGVATGQATIPLNGAGTSTPVSITVTAPNGSSQTYSITVNRAAPASPPPAPASAPDLIAEDDSCLRVPVTNECFPPTSEEDNITNVSTPRFQISQPGAGETPSLYVDGGTVAARFVQGALQPTSPLSTGAHSITNTVTNSAGLESPQSPSLSVTIDTVAPGFP